MSGYKDRQMDGQTDGWADERMDIQIQKCCAKISLITFKEHTQRLIDGWTDGQKDRWMSGQTDRQMDGQTDIQTDEWMDIKTQKCCAKISFRLFKEQTERLINRWTDGQMDRQTDG